MYMFEETEEEQEENNTQTNWFLTQVCRYKLTKAVKT